MKQNIYWFYVDYIESHLETFISAGLTTAAIVLVLKFMNVIAI